MVIDLTTNEERLATYRTLNKPLFYKIAKEVVEEVLRLSPQLDNRVAEIYAAIMFVVRQRRKNHNQERRRHNCCKKLRFQLPGSTAGTKRKATDDCGACDTPPEHKDATSDETDGYTTPPPKRQKKGEEQIPS